MPGNDLELYQARYGLTDKQAGLAFAYVETGILKSAAERSGVSYRYAKRLLHEHADFRRALTELFDIMLLDDMIKARAVARNLMEEAQSDKVVLDAVKLLWERAQGEPLRRVVHETADTDLEKLALKIVRLSRELGMHPPIEGTAIRIENGPGPKESKGTGTKRTPGSVRQEIEGQQVVAVQSGQGSSSNS